MGEMEDLETRLADSECKGVQLCNAVGVMMLACKRLRSVQDRHAEEGGANICHCEVCAIVLPDLSDEAIESLVNESNAQAAVLSAAEEWGKASAALQKADEAVANSPGNEYKQRSLAAGKAFGEEQDKLASLRKAVDELRRARGEVEKGE